jgi:hypothetical protein
VRIFTISKRSFDIAVQSAQYPDARMHHEITAFRSADQATDRGPPLVEPLVGLWKPGDVIACVVESNELAAVGGIGSSNGRDQSVMMQP